MTGRTIYELKYSYSGDIAHLTGEEREMLIAELKRSQFCGDWDIEGDTLTISGRHAEDEDAGYTKYDIEDYMSWLYLGKFDIDMEGSVDETGYDANEWYCAC